MWVPYLKKCESLTNALGWVAMKAPSISLWLIDNPCNRLAASDTANVALAGQTLDATLWDRCNWCLLLPFHRHNVNLEYIPLTTREILQSCIQTFTYRHTYI